MGIEKGCVRISFFVIFVYQDAVVSPRDGKNEIAHSLWAYLIVRIANKLWAICKFLTIKKIHLLHILKILTGKGRQRSG